MAGGGSALRPYIRGGSNIARLAKTLGCGRDDCNGPYYPDNSCVNRYLLLF